MATFTGAAWDIANAGGSSAVWRIYEGNTAPLLRSFLKPLSINIDGASTTYSIPGAETSGHLFGTGLATYSDQQGYDISFVTTPPVVPPVIPPVIKPSDGVNNGHNINIDTGYNIRINYGNNVFVSIDLNMLLQQISPLQLSTTFNYWFDRKLASFDDGVDADYGQFKGDNRSVTVVSYREHRGHGKKHWYEKRHLSLKGLLDRLLYMIENGGIRLPAGVIAFIPNANANSDSMGMVDASESGRHD
jgi:hypothetical protein